MLAMVQGAATWIVAALFMLPTALELALIAVPLLLFVAATVRAVYRIATGQRLR